MTPLRLALALFVLFSAGLVAQDSPQVSTASPAILADAPFLLPASPDPVAPVWLVLDCSQFDHGACHYIPDPAFPNECCIPSPKRVGCFSYCTIGE